MRETVQKEILEIEKKYNKCSFDVSVRLGKTFCMLHIASRFKNPIVSYPNQPIHDSWVADAKKFNIDISHITFTTNISLNKQDLVKYDCLICDECDTLSENNLEYIISNQSENIKMFTGTMPLINSNKRKLIETVCPIVYTKKLEDTIGHTSKNYQITVHLIDSSKTILKLKSGKDWNEQAKLNWLQSKYYKSSNWNDMLVLINAVKSSKSKLEYLKKLTNNDNREIIFVETKKQCDELKLPSYYSGNDDSEQNLIDFQENKINKLVTINQLKASITFNNLNKAVILHTYSNYAKAHQKLARCLTYSEGEIADIHILCIKDTIDFQWVNKSLSQFNKDKIKYINV